MCTAKSQDLAAHRRGTGRTVQLVNEVPADRHLKGEEGWAARPPVPLGGLHSRTVLGRMGVANQFHQAVFGIVGARICGGGYGFCGAIANGVITEAAD